MKKEFSDYLHAVDAKKAHLDSLRPLPEELDHHLDEWTAIELTYNSNALEGNTLSLKETALVVEYGLTIGGKTVREHLEAINHVHAYNFVKECATKSRTDLSLADIFDIHRLILKAIDDKNAGRLRMVSVGIKGTNIVFPSPLQLHDLMNQFMTWLHEAQGHPIIIAADAHYKLVSIHPFIDGNGRTSRLLMNLLLLQTGYTPAIIDVEKRKEYIDALEQYRTAQNPDAFYSLMC
ncbi:MAG TPA: Fic family protein, partial [Candidatus Bathyarchaeia archaeon]|nr:Fic family protein [Candidatus Bathyarchaeia archaeon]